MPVATMAKAKNGEGGSGEPGGSPQKKRGALNVSPEAHRIAVRIATLRGLNVEELFDEKDVREFFTHLLLEEMKKEAERLKGKK